jgi:hypothetical protein
MSDAIRILPDDVRVTRLDGNDCPVCEEAPTTHVVSFDFRERGEVRALLEGCEACCAEFAKEFCGAVTPEQPLPMLLNCPSCHGQHIDREEWANPEKAHKTHLCEHCGHLFRPSNVATVGVEALP